MTLPHIGAQRAAADVASEIRARLAGAPISAWPDEAMVAALEAVAARDTRAEGLDGELASVPAVPAVPAALVEEYGRARFGEHFPPAEPRLLARARAVRVGRQLGLLS